MFPVPIRIVVEIADLRWKIILGALRTRTFPYLDESLPIAAQREAQSLVKYSSEYYCVLSNIAANLSATTVHWQTSRQYPLHDKNHGNKLI
jgi:hypothetical protein